MAKKKPKAVSAALVRRVMREMGRKGGKARVPKGFAKKQLPKEKRIEAAKKAALARWKKQKDKPMKALATMVALILILVLWGCGETAMLIPVQGPLSQMKPVPVLKVRADGILGNSGKLSFLMPDGDKCTGRWSSAAGAGISVGTASLLSQYGSMYISGYSMYTGSGQNPGEALAVCGKGTTLQLEFVTGAGTAHGFGIGKDSEANVYRFIF